MAAIALNRTKKKKNNVCGNISHAKAIRCLSRLKGGRTLSGNCAADATAMAERFLALRDPFLAFRSSFVRARSVLTSLECMSASGGERGQESKQVAGDYG